MHNGLVAYSSKEHVAGFEIAVDDFAAVQEGKAPRHVEGHLLASIPPGKGRRIPPQQVAPQISALQRAQLQLMTYAHGVPSKVCSRSTSCSFLLCISRQVAGWMPERRVGLREIYGKISGDGGKQEERKGKYPEGTSAGSTRASIPVLFRLHT